MVHRNIVKGVVAIMSMAGPAAAQSNAAAQANNPLASTTALNFQNQYTGELSGTNRDANQLYLRYAQPFPAFGGQWLMRATLPVNTFPEAGGGDTTGIGDFNVFAAYLFDTGNPAISFGVGPQVTLPTATDDAIGSEKWSLGFANVLFNATNPKFQWGYLLTWQASVAGDDNRADVNVGAFQPFAFYQLGQGWYLRSTGTWTYDFETDNYAVPIGLGVGKVVQTDFATVNAFVEPQYLCRATILCRNRGRRPIRMGHLWRPQFPILTGREEPMTEFPRRLITGAALLCTTSLAAMAQDAVPLDQATLSGDETIATPYGTVELADSYFGEEDSQMLFDAMDLQRAAQLYIWSTPLVSMTTWRDAQGEAFRTDAPGAFVVLETLKEKRGIVTANLTTPYIFNFTDLSDGPVQIDYPAGQTAGGVLDMWQRPVFDLGLTGPDKGEGATYIVVGPEDDPAEYEADGVYVYQSATNNVLVGIRILDPDPAFYDTFVSDYAMGPTGETSTSDFIKGKDVEWSATAPRGLAYWEKLAAIVNEEPIREIDKPWMAMIAPLGIVKGQDFAPTDRQQEILTKGAALGELMARNLQVNPRYTDVWWDGTSWYKSFDFQVAQETDTIQQIDERATWFYEAVASTEGMVNPQPGEGQVYMTSKRDQNGEMLRADRNYMLHVPADVPVGQFWSVTLYSEETRRPYDNGGTEIADVTKGSRTESLQVNDDGSVDLYFGPDAPEGMESNHFKTVGDDGWFVYFRLYAPGEAFFDKSFALEDFQRVE